MSKQAKFERKADKDRSIAIALATLLVILAFLNKQYRSLGNYMNILQEASFWGVAGLGMMFVIITRNTDLSIGTQMALISIVVFKLLPIIGVVPSILIAMVLGVLLSTITGLMVVYVQIVAFIYTLSMQYVYRGISYMLTNSSILTTADPVFSRIGNLFLFKSEHFSGIPLPFIILIVLALGTWLLLQHTAFGRKVYAVGNGERASELAGINSKRIKLLCYALLGLYVGIASVMISSRLWIASAEMKTGYEFDVITVVILGGCLFDGGSGRVINTVLAAIFFATISNLINHFNVDAYTQYIIKALLMLAAFSVNLLKTIVREKIDQVSFRQQSQQKSET